MNETKALFDYVLVVTLTPGPDKNSPPEPLIDYRYPPAVSDIISSKHDAPTKKSEAEEVLLKNVLTFCFPDIASKKVRPKRNSRTKTYRFILTNEDFSKRYGYCVRTLPETDAVIAPKRFSECYCIISFLPCFSLFEPILELVEAKRHSCSKTEIFMFLKSILAQPFPIPGGVVEVDSFSSTGSTMEKHTFIRPPDADNLLAYIPILPLLKCVSVPELVKVFASLLRERPVMFVSTDVDILSDSVQAAGALVYPFSWQGVLVPVLSEQMLPMCASPTPLLVGILRHHLPLLQAMVEEGSMEPQMLFDLDKGAWIMESKAAAEDVDSLPQAALSKLVEALDNFYKTYKPLFKKDSKTEFPNEHFHIPFIEFFVDIFGHYQKGFSKGSANRYKWNQDKFIAATPAENKKFVVEFSTNTQMFGQFLNEREMHLDTFQGPFDMRINAAGSTPPAASAGPESPNRPTELEVKKKKGGIAAAAAAGLADLLNHDDTKTKHDPEPAEDPGRSKKKAVMAELLSTHDPNKPQKTVQTDGEFTCPKCKMVNKTQCLSPLTWTESRKFCTGCGHKIHSGELEASGPDGRASWSAASSSLAPLASPPRMYSASPPPTTSSFGFNSSSSSSALPRSSSSFRSSDMNPSSPSLAASRASSSSSASLPTSPLTVPLPPTARGSVYLAEYYASTAPVSTATTRSSWSAQINTASPGSSTSSFPPSSSSNSSACSSLSGPPRGPAASHSPQLRSTSASENLLRPTTSSPSQSPPTSPSCGPRPMSRVSTSAAHFSLTPSESAPILSSASSSSANSNSCKFPNSSSFAPVANKLDGLLSSPNSTAERERARIRSTEGKFRPDKPSHAPPSIPSSGVVVSPPSPSPQPTRGRSSSFGSSNSASSPFSPSAASSSNSNSAARSFACPRSQAENRKAEPEKMCTGCGVKLDKGLKFCTTCGTKVVQPVAATVFSAQERAIVLSAEKEEEAAAILAKKESELQANLKWIAEQRTRLRQGNS